MGPEHISAGPLYGNARICRSPILNSMPAGHEPEPAEGYVHICGASLHDPVNSIIIPAYNEHLSVGSVVTEVYQTLAGHGMPGEVIVVDDGSRDDTGRAAQRAGPA